VIFEPVDQPEHANHKQCRDEADLPEPARRRGRFIWQPERGAGVQALNLTLVEDDHACREEGDACRHGFNQTDGVKTDPFCMESRMIGDFDREDYDDRCRKKDEESGFEAPLHGGAISVRSGRLRRKQEQSADG
jgi:hypothetical protein